MGRMAGAESGGALTEVGAPQLPMLGEPTGQMSADSSSSERDSANPGVLPKPDMSAHPPLGEEELKHRLGVKVASCPHLHPIHT